MLAMGSRQNNEPLTKVLLQVWLDVVNFNSSSLSAGFGGLNSVELLVFILYF